MKKKPFKWLNKTKKHTPNNYKNNIPNLYGFVLHTDEILKAAFDQEVKTEDIEYTDLTNQKLLGDGDNNR